MLGLHCEKAGKSKSKKKEDICPEALREGKTKREECTFRFNINRPPSMGFIYFSKAVHDHSHALRPAAPENTIGLEQLTAHEILEISNLALMGSGRTMILRVSSCIAATDRLVFAGEESRLLL